MAQRKDEEFEENPPGYRTDTGIAELLADESRPAGWLLTLDRIGQSYVDLEHPTYLEFEYVQGFADVVECFFPPGERLDATHVGGGALTFPRYLLHLRPGSSQIVLEPDAALTALVRERLPLPKHSGIRVRAAAGREGVATLADASADLFVLDAFAGGRVPADLTTVEAVTDGARVLRKGGLFLANVADGPPIDYTRRLVATLHKVFAHVVIRSDPAVRKRRFGNVVLAASAVALPTDELVRMAHRAMMPTRVVSGDELRQLVGTAKPFSDADNSSSPQPAETWRVRGGW